jgi:hypothetical protein
MVQLRHCFSLWFRYFSFFVAFKGNTIYDTYWYYDFDTILIWFASVNLWTEPTWFLTILDNPFLIVQWGIFTLLGSFIYYTKKQQQQLLQQQKSFYQCIFCPSYITFEEGDTVGIYESYYPFLIHCSGRATTAGFHS